MSASAHRRACAIASSILARVSTRMGRMARLSARSGAITLRFRGCGGRDQGTSRVAIWSDAPLMEKPDFDCSLGHNYPFEAPLDQDLIVRERLTWTWTTKRVAEFGPAHRQLDRS